MSATFAPEEGYAPPTPKIMIASGLNRVIRSVAACAALALPIPPAQSTASWPDILPRRKSLDPRVRDSSVVMDARRIFDSMGTAQRSAIIVTLQFQPEYLAPVFCLLFSEYTILSDALLSQILRANRPYRDGEAGIYEERWLVALF
jgi:hypothetical protein